MKIKPFIIKIIITAIVTVCLVLIGCPFKQLTGFQCPACGTTRGWICLFNGEVGRAFEHNAFFWLSPLIVIAVVVDEFLAPSPRKVSRIFAYVSSFVLFTYGVIRLFSIFDLTECTKNF